MSRPEVFHEATVNEAQFDTQTLGVNLEVSALHHGV